jgi:hypothetical protein
MWLTDREAVAFDELNNECVAAALIEVQNREAHRN